MSVSDVGFAAFLITTSYTVLGLPAQIRRNCLKKSMEGQSIFMSVLLFFTFLSWVIYGVMKEDWYILGSNSPGALCIAFVLVQFWIYRGGRIKSSFTA